MIFKPWDCAQPDEWLPQRLRLCWGGDSDGGGGGGFSGDSGGWGGDSSGGFGGATTGGGDWGSSGNYDASGFNAGGDLNAWAGSAYDASSFPGGTLGGGDWGSFGTTNYGGMDAPNPTFADIAGPNPGVTTGGGDWGSAGAYSAAGMGGGPAGGLYGAAQGAASGAGGGFWGDSGGGGGGGYGGYGGYGGGGQQGGGSFGGFGSGTLGGSNAIAAAPTGPSGSTFADSYGGGSVAGPSSAAGSSHSLGGQVAAAASDAGPSESDAAPSEGGDTSTAPSESQFGEPTSAPEAEAAPEAAPEAEAAPAQQDSFASRFDAATPDAAPAETEAAPSAFGPQSVIAGGRETNFDYGPSQAYQDASQTLSDLTQSALATQPDSFDSRFGFDASAPDISASIPGGRETSFDYGPGQQTAGPDFNQSFEAFNAPGWNPADQLAGRAGLAEPTDWGANPYQPSTDVSVGRDFNQAFDAFGDTPTGMDLAGDMRTEDGSVNPNSTFQLGWEPANAYAGRGPDDASGRAAQDYVTSLVSGAPLGAAAPGLLSALSAATGIPAAAWLGGSVPTAGILGLMGLDPSARPTAPQQQVTEVELVSPQDVPAPPPPDLTPPPPQEVQPAQPQEAQPAQPEAQPQAQPPEAQQAQPQEAQQTQPQQTEQTQPQEAQPAPPSLIEQAQTLPAEVQPTAPPSLIEQAQSTPGTPLAFPGTPTTALPPQSTTARPVAPADEQEDQADPHANTPVVPGKPLGAPTTKTQNTPVVTDRVRQEQQGATRSRPVSEALHSILTRAAEQANVVVRIGSGGQPSTGRDRTGSHRHDHGNAADIRLEQNGRLLNYNNPTDRPIMEAFVREAARLGATGMGAGMRYMGPNTIHVGFGNPNFWRADNPGSLGLRQAWNEGRQGPANRPPADIPNVRTAQAPAITFYAPGAKGRMEGKYETSQPNPLTGKNTPSTLDDVRLGNSPFVTLAGNPSRYGEKVDLGTINYTSPIDGKTYTLNNVQGIVHDTGSAFKGRSDKLDVAVGDFRGWTSSKASTFVANNSRQQPAASQVAAVPQGRQTAALLPGRPGIGSDRSNIPWAPPAGIPAALPPVALPDPVTPRPPADIPAPAPPVAAPPTPAQIRASHITAAKGIIAEHSKGLNKDSGEAKATAAYVKAGAAMAKAGIPANIARAELLAASEKGAAQAGYTRTMFMIGGKVGAAIDAMVDAAMQSYQSALPGKRSDVGGQQYADLSQQLFGPAPIGSAGNAGSMTGRPGEIGAQQPMFSIPGLDRLSPITAPPAPPEPPANSRELASLFDTRFLAKGGHVAKDEPVVVGEEGPETFVPDQPGTVVPHMPPGGGDDFGRWPKVPTPDYPGRYAGVGREMKRQMREAQNPAPTLMDMIDSGRLRLNAANWHAMMNDPDLIALGQSRMGTVDAPAPEPAAEPPDPTSPMAQALGYGSIRRPMQIGRQSYQR